MNKQEEMPLVKRLVEHAKLNPVSFHVPGHKNGQLYPDTWQAFLKYDLTEITGMDDLYQPKTVIYEAMELLTEFYQTKQSYFLVNGTTSGNLAMILATVKRGEKVLVARNVHKSIIHALELAFAVPVFLTPDVDTQTNTASGISSEWLQRAFLLHPDIVACIFTYPSYYGTVFDLKACIEVAHRYKALVLVDEAHGAHLEAHQTFPLSSLKLGADIVVQSAHKTLPALTMGAFLHIGSDDSRLQQVPYYLQVVQSSSPSYLIMASLDIARHYIANYDEADFQVFSKMRDAWLQFLMEQGFEVILPADPLKMVIRKPNLSGWQILKIFEQNGYFPEFADLTQVLLILPLLKKEETFLPPEKWFAPELEPTTISVKSAKNKEITELAISYEQMKTTKTIFIPLMESIGRISAENIMSYPPGIPEILRGERITSEHFKILSELRQHHFQGGERLLAEEIKIYDII
ncbi:aminotransferase class I/II-fold pyridoxal phosphate-dependent enzyme [Listeria sp. PSOL-1]|uniref:aminotransferase class I/II-fold pyridoxal phosphate-dependent enzyme n=1 Tax=Listeria sp. PSOL-1 TaxID=1844999 RepID=UPI0013D6A5FE|nr:aminotransferase class V-fold PLP-dependent enzyme [Listeria sp. PSOL-1]